MSHGSQSTGGKRGGRRRGGRKSASQNEPTEAVHAPAAADQKEQSTEALFGRPLVPFFRPGADGEGLDGDVNAALEIDAGTKQDFEHGLEGVDEFHFQVREFKDGYFEYKDRSITVNHGGQARSSNTKSHSENGTANSRMSNAAASRTDETFGPSAGGSPPPLGDQTLNWQQRELLGSARKQSAGEGSRKRENRARGGKRGDSPPGGGKQRTNNAHAPTTPVASKVSNRLQQLSAQKSRDRSKSHGDLYAGGVFQESSPDPDALPMPETLVSPAESPVAPQRSSGEPASIPFSAGAVAQAMLAHAPASVSSHLSMGYSAPKPPQPAAPLLLFSGNPSAAQPLSHPAPVPTWTSNPTLDLKRVLHVA